MDLAPADPEPQLDPDWFERDAEAAIEDFNINHYSWGRRWHDALVRVCNWSKDRGMKILCDKPAGE